jgi:YfiR/HmsC-like
MTPLPRIRQPQSSRTGPHGGAPQATRCGLGAALLVFILILIAAPTLAQNQPTEDDVKAAYLFNFSHFVRYPAADPSIHTFDICLLGRDQIGRDLQSLVSNESVDGRPVRVLQPDRPGDARACAIVFLGSSEASRLDKDLAALDGSAALTVSDIAHFTDRGGMIQFVLQNNRVRFAVNLTPATHAHLGLSSELLKVALVVSPSPSAEAQ